MPTRAGGAGGRFFSLRRNGVTGKGSGGNPSPPVRCCFWAFGGGPQSIGAAVKFDVAKSGARYNLVNSMFDVMITYRLDDLRAAVGAVQKAEAKHAGGDNAEAKALIAEARALIDANPIDEAKSLDAEFAGIFTKKRKKATDEVGERQAEVEQQWDAMVVANYRKAKELADKAAGM